MQCAAKKNTPLNKYHYFQYISIFYYEIFRDYSGHNLPLLLRILSSQILFCRTSTSLSIKDDFFQLRRQINQTTANFQAYIKHKIRLKCTKNTSYYSLKTKISTTKFTRLLYSLYSKRPPSALTQARRRLRKLTITF